MYNKRYENMYNIYLEPPITTVMSANTTTVPSINVKKCEFKEDTFVLQLRKDNKIYVKYNQKYKLSSGNVQEHPSINELILSFNYNLNLDKQRYVDTYNLNLDFGENNNLDKLLEAYITGDLSPIPDGETLYKFNKNITASLKRNLLFQLI